MGQQASNRGRNATLDEKKRRAAGRRENSPERKAIADQFDEKPTKGATGGAFGRGKSKRSAGAKTRRK